MNKKMKINMVLNAIKGVLAVLFPLISFPYVSRVLGIVEIGKYNFANSILSYFLLIAGLGISTYAVRECSKVKDKKDELSKLANEIFSINVISTLIAYLLYFILIIIIPKFHDYTILLIILSLQIIFKTISLDWIFNVYEEYFYVTIRSIIMQILSLIFMFIFVRSSNDLIIYTIIMVGCNVISSLLNYFYAKKYLKVKFIFNIELKKHLKPIFLLFALDMMISVYLNSDITILGFFKDDYVVGLYSVSAKVCLILKNAITAIFCVSVPRLSYYIGNNDLDNYEKTATDISNTIFSLILPATTGVCMLCNEIIILISGYDYLAANISLVLLAISFIFAFRAYFWTQCVLIPNRKELDVLKVTIISALTNIILNLILIPIWSLNAAALTTIISEFIVFILCMNISKKVVNIKSDFSIILKSFIGCVFIIFTVLIVKLFINSLLLRTLLSILFSIIIYFIVEILLKNEVIKDDVVSILNKFKKKLNK